MSDVVDEASELASAGQFKEAEALLVSALEREANDAEAMALLGGIRCELGRRWEGLGDIDKAIEIDPTCADAYRRKAWALSNGPSLGRALEAADRACDLEPDCAEAHYVRGFIHFLLARWDVAELALRRPIEINPDAEETRKLLARAYLRQGKWDDALDELGEICCIDPTEANEQALEGWTALNEGRPALALEAFGKALRSQQRHTLACEGVVTSLKAESVPYRIALGFFDGLARLNWWTRWGSLAAGLAGARIFLRLTKLLPHWGIGFQALALVYVAFAYLTWIADPLFKLTLNTSYYGRLALIGRGRFGVLIGALLSGISAVGLYYWTQTVEWLILGAFILAMTILVTGIARLGDGIVIRKLLVALALLAVLACGPASLLFALAARWFAGAATLICLAISHSTFSAMLWSTAIAVPIIHLSIGFDAPTWPAPKRKC